MRKSILLGRMENSHNKTYGRAWTREEEVALRKEFEEKYTLDEIAEKHSRTFGAIRSRLVQTGLLEPIHIVPDNMVNTQDTYSREFLQGAQERHQEYKREQSIQFHVRKNERLVLDAATRGKTQCVIEVNMPSSVGLGSYRATLEDLLPAYQEKFPGCRVEFGEALVEQTLPNHYVKKTGIVIDWS